MGIRETQVFGLTIKAHKFLNENCKTEVKRTCPKCGDPIDSGKIKKAYDTESGVNCGMFDDGPILYEYELKDGKKAKEVVQASPWSSGPCIFLALEIDGKLEFEWDKEEIDNC